MQPLVSAQNSGPSASGDVEQVESSDSSSSASSDMAMAASNTE